MLKTQELIDILIDDLQKYSALANESAKKGLLTKENADSYEISENHCFSHEKNIKSRLNRIFNFLDFARMQVSTDQIHKLWDILVVTSELRKIDQNPFFDWFKRMMTRDQRRLVTEETLLSLFKEKIVASDSRMFKSLRITGFDVIVRLFVLVNELEGNV